MPDTITPPRGGTEAYDLVLDLRSNLTGDLGYARDQDRRAADGYNVAQSMQRDALDAISRTFANPEAAAFLNRNGKAADDMERAVRNGNLRAALAGVPDISTSQQGRNTMADDTTKVPVQQERAADYTDQRQQSAALYSQAQRDAGRARTEFAQARAAAPPAGASTSREPAM